MYNNSGQTYEIILNVYDLAPDSTTTRVFKTLGIGFYHSGIEINGTEYTYGGNFNHNNTGVFTHAPLQADGVTYKESYLLGEVKDISKIMSAIDMIKA
jgi:hypothetical protein